MKTQVNMGFSGPIGLRYEGCVGVLDLHGLHRPDVWAGLRLIELAYVVESMKKTPPKVNEHARR